MRLDANEKARLRAVLRAVDEITEEALALGIGPDDFLRRHSKRIAARVRAEDTENARRFAGALDIREPKGGAA